MSIISVNRMHELPPISLSGPVYDRLAADGWDFWVAIDERDEEQAAAHGYEILPGGVSVSPSWVKASVWARNTPEIHRRITARRAEKAGR